MYLSGSCALNSRLHFAAVRLLRLLIRRNECRAIASFVMRSEPTAPKNLKLKDQRP
jgi:hypothetical protein